MTGTVRRRGVRRLVAALLAFLGGAGALLAVFAIGNRLIDQWHRACNYPRPPVPPQMPWYALPLGVTSTALMVLSTVLALVARRRMDGAEGWQVVASLLAVAAVFGALVGAWFGVYAVIADATTTVHCGG
jgi:cytochrome bd-type quinol oxidase subunit 2